MGVAGGMFMALVAIVAVAIACRILFSHGGVTGGFHRALGHGGGQRCQRKRHCHGKQGQLPEREAENGHQKDCERGPRVFPGSTPRPSEHPNV